MADHHQQAHDYTPSQTYSTLEFAGQNSPPHYTDSTAPEVVIPAQKEYYQAPQSQAPEYIPPQQATPQHATPQPAEPSARRSLICGLSRRAFWITAIVLILCIGGLVGGLAGGLSTRSQSSTAAAGTPTPTSTPGDSSTNSSGPATGVLVNSSIAALNWTDENNNDRRAVFYQREGALFYSMYHLDNNSWTQFNISNLFAREDSDNALKVKPGTALAVAAVSGSDDRYLQAVEGTKSAFSACLYFTDTDNLLREVWTSNYNLTGWIEGRVKAAHLVTRENSRLGALAWYCPNTATTTSATCTDQFVTMYQDADSNIKLAYGADWTNTETVAKGYPGGSLAFFAFASDWGTNISDVSELRMMYYSDTEFDMYIHNAGGMVPGNTIMSGQTGPDNDLPQIVASPCDNNEHAIAITMDGAGKFRGSFFDIDTSANDGWQSNQIIQFQNEDGKMSSDSPDVELTSIGMDHNGSLYGISSDGKTIVSYSWSSDPSARYNLVWKENIVVS